MFGCPYDNSTLAEAHLNKQEAELEGCPVCAWCKEPIQDDYGYEMEEGVVCPHCIESAKVWLW